MALGLVSLLPSNRSLEDSIVDGLEMGELSPGGRRWNGTVVTEFPCDTFIAEEAHRNREAPAAYVIQGGDPEGEPRTVRVGDDDTFVN